jgi:hypothetical protein
MQAYYPHQEFDDDTVEGFQFDMERLAARYGMHRMRTVLLAIRIRPGQRFFPHPSQIAEELEELMAKERQELLKAHPFKPCSRCMEGMLVEEVERDGKWRREARECECKRQWRRDVAAAKGGS